MSTLKVKDTQFEFHKVGKCYSMDLQGEGAFLDVSSKRLNDSDSPVFLGMMVAMIAESEGENVKKFFLGRVESIRPDNDSGLNLKEAVRNSQTNEVNLDTPYKKLNLMVNYRVKILGLCEIKEDPKNPLGAFVDFRPNVRTLPAVVSLQCCIPNHAVMKSLFEAAILQTDDGSVNSFEIGYLQYGSVPEYTDKYYKVGTDQQVPVLFNVSNLLRKRTGIFGKSGYGKSNTVKTVLGMVATQFPNCGVLIFDTNGEYALENDQNDGFMDIFHEAGMKEKCTLYTQRKIHNSKREKFGKTSFKPLKFDVFENISASMDIIIANLNGQTVPMYLQAWQNESQGVDDQKILFENQKNKGLIWGMWFKTCLDAGLMPLNEKNSICETILNKKFLDYLATRQMENELEEIDDDSLTPEADKEKVTVKFDNLDEVKRKEILDTLDAHQKGVGKGSSVFTRNVHTMAMYAEWYAEGLKKKEAQDKKSGHADEEQKTSSIKGYTELLKFARRLYQLKAYHIGDGPESKGAKSISLGESVWQDLLNKKIVIIDLASVSTNVSKILTEQIAAVLLNKSSAMFGDYEQQEQFKNFDVITFIEEAQNYLSPEQVSGGSGIFERLAKEGRKFHLGLVYVTQQPSAIDQKITSQTENLIVMHLSNTGDTMMLNKIKDKFDLLTCRFLKDEAQKGLAYLYAEPHQPFVLQAQIHKFDKKLILDSLANYNKKLMEKGKK